MTKKAAVKSIQTPTKPVGSGQVAVGGDQSSVRRTLMRWIDSMIKKARPVGHSIVVMVPESCPVPGLDLSAKFKLQKDRVLSFKNETYESIRKFLVTLFEGLMASDDQGKPKPA